MSLLKKIVVFQRKDEVCTGLVFFEDDQEIRAYEYKPVMFSSFQIQRMKEKMEEEKSLITSLEEKRESLKSRQQHKLPSDYGSFEETLLDFAIQRLEGVTIEEWHDFFRCGSPSHDVIFVATTAVRILGERQTLSWKEASTVLQELDLKRQLQSIKEKPLDKAFYDEILEALDDGFFSLDLSNEKSRCGIALQKWITAFMDYQRARFFNSIDQEVLAQIDNTIACITSAEKRKKALEDELSLVLEKRLLRRTADIVRFHVNDVIRVLEDCDVGEPNQTIAVEVDAYVPVSSTPYQSPSLVGDNVSRQHPSKNSSFSTGGVKVQPSEEQELLTPKVSSSGSTVSPIDPHEPSKREDLSLGDSYLKRISGSDRLELGDNSDARRSIMELRSLLLSLEADLALLQESHIGVCDDYEALLTEYTQLVEETSSRPIAKEHTGEKSESDKGEKWLVESVLRLLRGPSGPSESLRDSAEDCRNLCDDTADYLRGVLASLS